MESNVCQFWENCNTQKSSGGWLDKRRPFPEIFAPAEGRHS
jgi:hypothetical protein